LLARMEALLRRNTPRSLVEINGLLWNKEQFELTFKSQFIKLTPKEFIMIGHFMKNPNQVFGREQLIDLIWGFDSETEGRTVDRSEERRVGKEWSARGWEGQVEEEEGGRGGVGEVERGMERHVTAT